MKDGKIKTDLHVKPTDTHQYLDFHHVPMSLQKLVFLTAKLCALIEYVPVMPSLIRDVTNQSIDKVKELLGKKY